MTKTSVAIALLASTAACGDQKSPNDQIDAPTPQPDMPPDMPPVIPGTKIAIDTFDTPSLLAFKDGDQAWRKVPSNGGQYEIEVHGPYLVAIVCDDGSGFIDVELTAQTLADPHEVFGFCAPGGGGGGGQPIQITGTMAQRGKVSLGFSSRQSTTPNWNFDLPTNNIGVESDFIAASASRIAIRHGLVFDVDTALSPAINVNTEGKPLVATNFAIANPAAGETVQSFVSLFTLNNTFFSFPGTAAAQAKLPPVAVIAPGDRVRANLFGSLGNQFRQAFYFQLDPANIPTTTFIDPVPGAAVVPGNAIAGTWTSVPASAQQIEIEGDAFTADFTTQWFHLLTLSPNWITETNATSAAIDTNIPGFLPQWKIDFAQEYTVSVYAQAFDQAVSYTAGISETVTPALHAQPNFDHARQRRERIQLLRAGAVKPGFDRH